MKKLILIFAVIYLNSLNIKALHGLGSELRMNQHNVRNSIPANVLQGTGSNTKNIFGIKSSIGLILKQGHNQQF